MASARYITLKARNKALRRCLLPSRFDPTGSYLDMERVRARTLSYRVLAHAEIETFLEDRVVEIAKTCWAAWKSTKHVSQTTVHLLGFSGGTFDAPPATLEAPGANQLKNWPDAVNVDGRLQKSVADYILRVNEKNHGIREKNLMSMLLPIGYPHPKIDGLLVKALDSFGKDRGEAAHSSSSGQITQGIDPSDEYKRSRKLIEDLLPVDVELSAILKSAKSP